MCSHSHVSGEDEKGNALNKLHFFYDIYVHGDVALGLLKKSFFFTVDWPSERISADSLLFFSY